MKFSERVLGIEISGIRKMFEGAGPDSINMGLGQPDFDTPPHIKKAAIDAINAGYTGYTVNLGDPLLREAICGKFKRENNVSFDPNEVIVTAGASEALHLALFALVQEGDEVIVPDPGFVSYSSLASLAGGKIIGAPLNEDLSMDPETVADLVTDKTKVIVLNSPSNPTGAVQTEEEIKAFADLATDKNVTLVSDEVYEHLIYEGKHISPAQFTDNAVTINAVSKTYAMTGWRIGYAAARTEYIEQMLKVHQYIQACACSISQKAAIAAVTGPQDCVRTMCDEFRKRRDHLMGRFNDIGIRCVRPKGAFYVFPEVSDSEKAASILIQNGVIAVPGTAFGENGRGHIRLSYATSMDNIRKALARIEKVAGEL